MARAWPFLIFAVVAAVHVVQLLLGVDSVPSKVMLMPALVIAVFLAARLGSRLLLRRPRALVGLMLLELMILAWWLADVVWERTSDRVGIAVSILALLLGVLLSVVSLQAVPTWRSAAWYLGGGAVLVAGFVAFAGADGLLIGAYGVCLVAMAYFAGRANRLSGIGGILFVVAALVKGLVLFLPGAVAGLGVPVQDAIVMTGYSAGLGMIALGAVRRLEQVAGVRDPVRRGTFASPQVWEIRGINRSEGV